MNTFSPVPKNKLADKSRSEQLAGIATALRNIFDNGLVYSTSNAHYNDFDESFDNAGCIAMFKCSSWILENQVKILLVFIKNLTNWDNAENKVN